jgi:hypothetical protein
MKLPPFLDPDRAILSVPTLQHFIGFAVVAFLLQLRYPDADAFVLAVAIGALWELAQWDTCRHLPICHQGERLDAPFKPGFGFGLMDLAADALGAGLVVLVT